MDTKFAITSRFFQKLSIFLAVVTLFVAQNARANSACSALFTGQHASEFSIDELNKAAAKASPLPDGPPLDLVKKFAIALFSQNSKSMLSLDRKNLWTVGPVFKEAIKQKLPLSGAEIVLGLHDGSVQMEVVAAPRMNDSTLQIYEVRLTKEGRKIMNYEIRTNGRVAFLHNSWAYRGKEINAYRAVLLRDSKAVVSFDVGNTVLSSLPENVTISRSLGEAERKRWLENDLEDLGSPFLMGRIHFAPKYYVFTGRVPYVVTVPRSLLIRLYSEGLLEINSYDPHVVNPDGMMPSARTSFGLEVEYVFKKEAAQSLRPWLEPALRQGLLDL